MPLSQVDTFSLARPILLWARISDTPQWPPAILFDAVYAGALLHHFGTQELKDTLATTWRDVFNPHGTMTADEREERKQLQAQN